jgi:hypothetical protein
MAKLSSGKKEIKRKGLQKYRNEYRGNGKEEGKKMK